MVSLSVFRLCLCSQGLLACRCSALTVRPFLRSPGDFSLVVNSLLFVLWILGSPPSRSPGLACSLPHAAPEDERCLGCCCRTAFGLFAGVIPGFGFWPSSAHPCRASGLVFCPYLSTLSGFVEGVRGEYPSHLREVILPLHPQRTLRAGVLLLPHGVCVFPRADRLPLAAPP